MYYIFKYKKLHHKKVCKLKLHAGKYVKLFDWRNAPLLYVNMDFRACLQFPRNYESDENVISTTLDGLLYKLCNLQFADSKS